MLKIINALNRLLKRVPYNTVPRIEMRNYSSAMTNPLFRRTMVECSILEDEENSYYTGILNTISEHCCGSVPLVVGNHKSNEVNDAYEDKWLSWTLNNGIGSVIRQIRRSAARTGLGIAIPYFKENSEDQVKLCFKTLCLTDLQTPQKASIKDRIYDGIEYDRNWDIKSIWVNNGTYDPKQYKIDDIIVWGKQIKEGLVQIGPECGPAFTLYPSVKRYMEAIVKAEEFRASMPMAMELDPAVWGRESIEGSGPPKGVYKYDPGTVPTLPPGVKMVGIPMSISSSERTQYIELVIGASSRCIQMPKNLALGDSSKHNMASSQFDMQPWVNRVRIDRTDFEVVTRKIFRLWKERAILASNYLPMLARTQNEAFSFSLNYDSIFQHPDPNKNATARQKDLISGATTLTRIYKDMGQNARRELQRDADLLRMSFDEFVKTLVVSRSKQNLDILGEDDEEEPEEKLPHERQQGKDNSD